MSYEPLHHKYRPQTFANLVGQEAIATTLSNAIRTERIAPAYLFSGPRGTGKTSSARILAKSLNCLKQDKPTASPCGQCEVCRSITSGSALDVIEIDAASNTGVDNIRELIEKSQFAPVQCRYKVYVIDECHMLSVAAFNALLKTLEEPPKHVVFVLATTDPQRVLPTIISRCQRFDFRRIPLDAMVGHLQEIAAKENIDITLDAVTLVAQVAQGGLRDAESLLDQLSLLPEQVTVEAVWDLVGAVPERDLMALTTAIYDDNSETVLDHCRRLMDRGREPLVVLQNLAGFYRDLLIAKTAPDRNDLVAVTPPTWKQLREFAQKQDISRILQGQQHLKNSEAQIKNTTQPRLWLEVTLLGLLPSANPVISPSTHLGSRQESPTRSEPGFRSAATPSVSPHNSTVQQAPSVKQASPPVTSGQSEVQSSPQATAPTSVTQTQASQVQSQQPSAAKASPPSELTSPPVQPVEQACEPIREANTPAANPFNSEQSIAQIWQQVLSALQPFATQALLRQHCHLVSFEGSIANVVISSKPLMKLAQEKLPNIEAAFEAVYNSKVKVRLQTKEMQPAQAATRESTASRSVRETVPQSAIAQPETHASSTVTAQQVSPEYKQEQKVSAASTWVQSTGSENKQDTSPTYPTESPSISQQQSLRTAVSSPVQSESPAPLPVTESPASFLLQDVEWATEEIEKALGNLKQFFEGEIIDLNNDFRPPELSSIHALKSDEDVDDETEILVVEGEEDEDFGWVEPADSPQWQTSQLASLDSTHLTRTEELEYDDNGDIAF
ncbi:MAG: DNA polymerase III subunit gamma/tau [Cyanobacteriota bacterium]